MAAVQQTDRRGVGAMGSPRDVHAARRALEDEYKRSAFGAMRAGLQIAVRSGPRCAYRMPPAAVEEAVAVVALRAMQPVLTALTRPPRGGAAACDAGLRWLTAPPAAACGGGAPSRVCAPHVGYKLGEADAPGLPLDGTKWTAAQKVRAGLAQTLAYVFLVCARDWRGALFCLPVQNEGHSNFVYVDLAAGARARCLLFEPNGRAYARRTGGVERLRRAAARANALLGGAGAFEAGAAVVNVEGVQAQLGMVPVRAAGRRRVSRGFAVCASVTHWAIHLWVQEQPTPRTFEAFVRDLEARVRADRPRAWADLLAFMQGATRLLASPARAVGAPPRPRAQRRSVYAQQVHEVLSRDLAALARGCARGCTDATVTFRYRCSVGDGALAAAGGVVVPVCHVDLT